MYQLDTTTKSFQFKFGEADTTASMWACAFSEITVTTDTIISIASSDGTSNGTTAVTVVSSPTSGNSTILKHFSLYNADNITHTFEWQLNDNSTIRTVFFQTIPSGGSIICNGEGTWSVFDAAGALVATSAPTPNTLVLRDSNANFQTNAVDQAIVTTVVSGGTTTLTASSAPQQQFTGTTTQTVALPDATTLNVGHVFRIMNRTTGQYQNVTVNNYGGAAIWAVSPNCDMRFTLLDNSTSNGTWDYSDLLINTAIPNNAVSFLPIRDSNGNFEATTVFQSVEPRTTSGSPLTLNNGDPPLNYFVGTSNQTVTLPAAPFSVSNPQWFKIINLSTGVITVQNASSITVATIPAGGGGVFTAVGPVLSSTDWFYIASGVSSVTASSPLASSGGATPNISISYTAPTVQRFTSGSGTYTTPSSPPPLYIKVRMVGGGGGGAGSSTSANNASNGGNGGSTTFGSQLTANGGGGGQATGSGGTGGSGGTASLGSITTGTAITGNGGGAELAAVNNSSATAGAGSPLFGGGGYGNYIAGGSGSANSGGGGAGAGGASSGAIQTGGSGGSGGCIDAIISSPAASYSYAVGAGGSAGSAGTNGYTGGAGGSGYIIVEEYYQ